LPLHPSDKDKDYKASIIILSYNYSQFLAQAIESALNQDFNDYYEVIAVDDGSTDSSQDIITKYPVKALFFKENTKSWIADPLNAAISIAKGKYIGYLAADDILLPNYLSETVKEFEATSAGLVRVGMIEFDGTNEMIRLPTYCDDISKEILINNQVLGSSPFLKEAWFKIGGFKPLIYQDWEFWARLILSGYKVSTIFKPLYKHRIHRSSITGQIRENIAPNSFKQAYQDLLKEMEKLINENRRV